ncbi:MAG: efflux RND transporter periplasmic adaptor subunit, partial [Gemmatimonadota bacterium]|nr:efflux RND transporter periplasmic adaptor subunit [Gemmatimonadota bacterium]
MTNIGLRPERCPLHISRRRAALAVFAVLSVGACAEKKPPPRATPVVAVTKAVRGPLPYVVNAPGQVEPARTVNVQSQVSGMLTRVAFSEGDEVKQGQVLFEIDPRPFRAELLRVTSNLARDSTNLAQANGVAKRYAALAKDGYVTGEQMDQVNATAAALVGTVAADKASVDAAKVAVDQSVIRAPISGRTGILALKAGNLVRASTDLLVTINEVRPVLVKFSIPERDFAEMRKRAGTAAPLEVGIRPGASSDSARVIPSKLAFVDNSINQSTGTVILKSRAPNTDGALWPGQFVQVGLELSVDSNTVTVPSQAVVTSQTGTFVFVVDEASKAQRRPVKVGRTSGLLVVIAEGLEGGETVITDGQNRLNDNVTVEIRSLTGRGGRGGDGKRGKSVANDSS